MDCLTAQSTVHATPSCMRLHTMHGPSGSCGVFPLDLLSQVTFVQGLDILKERYTDTVAGYSMSGRRMLSEYDRLTDFAL